MKSNGAIALVKAPARTLQRGRERLPRKLNRSEILAALGLEQRRSTLGIVLPGVGLLAAGALLGIGLTLVFAPQRVLSRLQQAAADEA